MRLTKGNWVRVLAEQGMKGYLMVRAEASVASSVRRSLTIGCPTVASEFRYHP